MPRTSSVHYIAPSSIAITPNANGSANDLAVYLARGATIKVYSKGIAELATENGAYREWTLTGRNRRLADSAVRYTIYARLPKDSTTGGYLVFAPQTLRDGVWVDKYSSVTQSGYSVLYTDNGFDVQLIDADYWYIRLGDVYLPENDQRTVTLDTGILGTDQYNEEWNLDPDTLPIRVVVSNAKGADVPYVRWGESIDIAVNLIQGWETDINSRVHHWTIERDTGNAAADALWGVKTLSQRTVTLTHRRPSTESSAQDDFGGAVSATFTLKAWSVVVNAESGNSPYEEIASGFITILAETAERYDLVLSADAVTYNPSTETYAPAGGIDIQVRATAEDGAVRMLTAEEIDNAGLELYYEAADGSDDDPQLLTFSGEEGEPGTATLPTNAFADGKGKVLRLYNLASEEVAQGLVNYRRQSIDGAAVERVYIRSKYEVAPVLYAPASRIDSQGRRYTEDGYLPAVHRDAHAKIESNADGGVGSYAETTASPKGADDTYRYEWMAERTKAAPLADGTRTWNPYPDGAAMKLFSKKAEDAAHLVLDSYLSQVVLTYDGAVAKAFDTNYARFYVGNTLTTPTSWGISISPTPPQEWNIMTTDSGGVRAMEFRDEDVISATGRYVATVTAVYRGVTYSARWEINVERESVTYSIEAEPQNFIYNETRQTWEQGSLLLRLLRRGTYSGDTYLTAVPSGMNFDVQFDVDKASEEGKLTHATGSSYWNLQAMGYEAGMSHIAILAATSPYRVIATLSIQTIARNEATIRPRTWTTGESKYLSGAEGEMYKDVLAYDNGQGTLTWYQCIRTTPTGFAPTTGQTPADYPTYFVQADGQFEFVATNLMLAQLAYIKNLGVNYLRMGAANGPGLIQMLDAQGHVQFEVTQGNVIANSGTFNNIHIAGQSTFGGLLKKSKRVITRDNLDEYCDTVSGVNHILSLEKTGTWIEVRNASDEILYLRVPSINGTGPIYSTGSTDSERRDNVRALVGNTIILYHSEERSRGDLEVYGHFKQSGRNYSVASLQPGDWIQAICRLGATAGNKEEVYWEIDGYCTLS